MQVEKALIVTPRDLTNIMIVLNSYIGNISDKESLRYQELSKLLDEVIEAGSQIKEKK